MVTVIASSAIYAPGGGRANHAAQKSRERKGSRPLAGAARGPQVTVMARQAPRRGPLPCQGGATSSRERVSAVGALPRLWAKAFRVRRAPWRNFSDRISTAAEPVAQTSGLRTQNE